MGLIDLEKMCPNEFLQNRSARYLRSAHIRCTGVMMRLESMALDESKFTGLLRPLFYMIANM